MEYKARKRGAKAVKVVIHFPETPQKQDAFDALVAKFHAEYVAQYIEKINCPTDQKMRLIDAVAEEILAAEEGKNDYI